MKPLYIVIPAYNERENIEDVIDDWYPIVEKAETEGAEGSRLIIIDDGSKDDTFTIMQECAKSRPLFTPLTKQNSGHGATLLFGYDYALKNGAGYIFQTDSDGQTLPEEFQEFWDLRDEYDMVIGHRSARQDGVSRIIVTKTLKAVIKICFGADVRDANTPYRFMKAETLKKYIDLVPKDFNLSNVIISVIYVKKGCGVKWVPITFRPRQGGVNSINMKKIIGIGKKAVRDFKRINEVIK